MESKVRLRMSVPPSISNLANFVPLHFSFVSSNGAAEAIFVWRLMKNSEKLKSTTVLNITLKRYLSHRLSKLKSLKVLSLFR